MSPPPPADSASIPHPPPTHSASAPPPHTTHNPSVLDRPPTQRKLEYQYRFAQSAVFGLPVLALQFFGHSLGGAESHRWVAILQVVLAGWVVYVGAAGMLFEGLLTLLQRRRLTADLLPAAAAVALYLLTLLRLAAYTIAAAPGPFPTTGFHWTVLLLATWTGYRWWRYARLAG